MELGGRAVGGPAGAFRDAVAYRSWAIEANDGVTAAAGLLFGFAGAGASNRLLLFTAAAATIAGGLSVGGASWAEEAAERDAELLHAKQERDLSADPAKEVARQLSAHDALAAQLEWEHRFDQPMPATFPLWFGVGAGLAYMFGALVPLLITYFALAARCVDDLDELLTRVRRARNKYTKLYRRQSADLVAAKSSRAGTSTSNLRTKRKAEIFEDALAAVRCRHSPPRRVNVQDPETRAAR